MASPPLCIAILVVNASSSIATVLPTRQARSYLQTFLALFGRSVREIVRKLCRRTLASAGRGQPEGLRRGRNFVVSSIPRGSTERPAEAGCANPVSLSRISSRTAESASPSNFFSPLAWVVDSGIIRPETNAPHWVQKAGFGQTFVASAQKVMFHGGILREFSVVAR